MRHNFMVLDASLQKKAQHIIHLYMQYAKNVIKLHILACMHNIFIFTF